MTLPAADEIFVRSRGRLLPRRWVLPMIAVKLCSTAFSLSQPSRNKSKSTQNFRPAPTPSACTKTLTEIVGSTATSSILHANRSRFTGYDFF
jgi:hypothetical protein